MFQCFLNFFKLETENLLVVDPHNCLFPVLFGLVSSYVLCVLLTFTLDWDTMEQPNVSTKFETNNNQIHLAMDEYKSWRSRRRDNRIKMDTTYSALSTWTARFLPWRIFSHVIWCNSINVGVNWWLLFSGRVRQFYQLISFALKTVL